MAKFILSLLTAFKVWSGAESERGDTRFIWDNGMWAWHFCGQGHVMIWAKFKNIAEQRRWTVQDERTLILTQRKEEYKSLPRQHWSTWSQNIHTALSSSSAQVWFHSVGLRPLRFNIHLHCSYTSSTGNTSCSPHSHLLLRWSQAFIPQETLCVCVCVSLHFIMSLCLGTVARGICGSHSICSYRYHVAATWFDGKHFHWAAYKQPSGPSMHAFL